jgi:hypothetical protein
MSWVNKAMDPNNIEQKTQSLASLCSVMAVRCMANHNNASYLLSFSHQPNCQLFSCLLATCSERMEGMQCANAAQSDW